MNLSSLSPSRQRLVHLMQSVNFGRLERLVVKGGDPVSDPRPRVIRLVKLSVTNGPRPEGSLDDFVLKQELIGFFEQLDLLGDGMIAVIDIRHGLPLVMEIEGALAT